MLWCVAGEAETVTFWRGCHYYGCFGVSLLGVVAIYPFYASISEIRIAHIYGSRFFHTYEFSTKKIIKMHNTSFSPEEAWTFPFSFHFGVDFHRDHGSIIGASVIDSASRRSPEPSASSCPSLSTSPFIPTSYHYLADLVSRNVCKRKKKGLRSGLQVHKIEVTYLHVRESSSYSCLLYIEEIRKSWPGCSSLS